MNLAFKDVKYNFLRFLLTTAGVGFLIMASTGMVGLYRGIVGDALLVVDKIGADLWVVQGAGPGPSPKALPFQQTWTGASRVSPAYLWSGALFRSVSNSASKDVICAPPSPASIFQRIEESGLSCSEDGI
ncbi:hypothetical protein [Rhizobium oryzihabitans]|uniref:hypothetical protein n=1 Tax=Rhizobium oryzihabitans TaxID=2267833 RepID=UPI001FEB5671|nr:hypothetical protein [Rhizobium oryzihabitans]